MGAFEVASLPDPYYSRHEMETRSRRWVVWGGLLAALFVGLLASVLPMSSGPTVQGRPLRHWLLLATSESYQERLAGEQVLRGLGPEAVPELIRALHPADGRVRQFFERLLRQSSPGFGRSDRSQAIALLAAQSLGRLGRAALPAAPALAEEVGADSELGCEAARALVRLGPGAMPQVLEVLEVPRKASGNRSTDALARSARARRVLLDQLNFEEVRDGYGSEVSSLVTVLLVTLADPEPEARALAARVLAEAGRGDPRVVPALVPLLRSEVRDDRIAAMRTLNARGAEAGPAVAAIQRLLEAPDAEERLEAAQAIGSITGEAGQVVPVLIELLEDAEVGWRAASALGQLGLAAETAIPALLGVLEREVGHRPSRTPSLTALTLRRLGPKAIPGLVALLAHTNSTVRMGAAVALAGCATNSPLPVPSLVDMLATEDPEERMVAANALASIGPPALAAVPALARVARETSGEVSVGHAASAAREALRRLAPESAGP